MTKTLLIIGAGREQILAYQTAKNMGCFVIGTDINPNAPAFAYSDKNLICSTRNPEETLSTVLEFSKNHKIDGVMTIANDVPYTVALVASKLDLPGISLQSAKLVSNKKFMKFQFVKYSVPTPEYHVVTKEEELKQLLQKLDFPLILKPSDGRGSRGVLRLEKDSDLSFAWNHSMKHSENKILLLEKYISGDQLSVEGVFYNGKFHGLAFADRNYENFNQTKPFIVEDGGSIPSKYEGEILDIISNIIEKASKSLGITWGSIKADIILSNNGPMIIELAARLSGNYLATHHIPLAYGIDIISIVIKNTLGEPIPKSSLISKFKRFLGVRYFFPTPGKILKIENIPNVKNSKNLRMLEFFSKEGDTQPIIDNHAARAGTIVCEGNSYDEAIQITENLVKQIHFITK